MGRHLQKLGKLAEWEGSTLRYFHQDSLSSTSLMTDSSGGSLGTIKFTPFGSARSGSVPTDIMFTGQRLDATDLYYYGARYYDPSIGRFISPDSIVPDPTNPQAFNRYSYVLNNPLKYIDPTGQWWTVDAECNTVWEYEDGTQVPDYVYYARLREQQAASTQPPATTPPPATTTPPASTPPPAATPPPTPQLPLVTNKPVDTKTPEPEPPPAPPPTVITPGSDQELQPEPESKPSLKQTAAIVGQVFVGGAMMASGTYLMALGVATFVSTTVGSMGILWWLGLGLGAPTASAGYAIFRGGLQYATLGRLTLPWLPRIPR